MTRGLRGRLVGSMLIMLFVGARTARAESEAVNRCLAATEQGQLARQKAEYRAAREHFRVCAGESCPEAVSKDCARWLDELDRAQPTVLLSARDANKRDMVGVTVRIDDATPVQVGARAIEIDPGEHRFVFRTKEGKSVEQRILIRESEKNRVVAADFPAPTPPPPKESADVVIPVSSWVLGAAGVVAVGVGAGLLIAGKVEEEHLAATCVDRCPHDDVDAVRRSYWGGSFTLGGGIALLAVAVIIAAVSQPDAQTGLEPPLRFRF